MTGSPPPGQITALGRPELVGVLRAGQGRQQGAVGWRGGGVRGPHVSHDVDPGSGTVGTTEVEELDEGRTGGSSDLDFGRGASSRAGHAHHLLRSSVYGSRA